MKKLFFLKYSFLFILQFFFLELYALNNIKISEKPMVVVIPSYNNSQWYKKNIDSVLNQKYENFRVIYVDDASTDGTADLVDLYCKTHPRGKKVTIIKSPIRQGAAGSRYIGIHACLDDEIVVNLDGDDWLGGFDKKEFVEDEKILSLLNTVYQDENIWVTYSQYVTWPHKKIGLSAEYPKNIIQTRNYRHHPWLIGHLRTFYAWIFKCIKKEDFFYENQFTMFVDDFAKMFPIFEMAGTHIKYIDKILYVYNQNNPIATSNLSKDYRNRCEKFFRNKNKYPRLVKKNNKSC